MKGRKPQATAVKERSGAYRKDPQRRNSAAPTADGQIPAAPDHFNADEQQKWDELTQILSDLGIMSSDCGEIMVAYCTAYGGWMEARRQVAELGGALVEDGKIRRNPWSVELHKYRDQMNRLLPELGLTPSAKGRLVVPKKEENAVVELLQRFQAN